MNNIIDEFIEVELVDDSSFNKIKETLTRIGVGAKDNKFWQSCHILHKRGKYYIVHFKELYMLDGKETNYDKTDEARRTEIALMLENWNLLKIKSDISEIDRSILHKNSIKIIPFVEKDKWELCAKYNIGNKKQRNEYDKKK